MTARSSRRSLPATRDAGRLLTALAAFALVATVASRPAGAVEEGFSLTVFPMFSSLTGDFGTAIGGGVGVDVAYGFGEGFSVRAVGSYTRHPAVLSGTTTFDIDVLHAAVGITYALDVLRMIPFVDLAPGVYSHTLVDGTTAYDFGVEVGIGVDYLINRRFAVGAMARYHLFVSNISQFPAYTQIGPRASIIW